MIRGGCGQNPWSLVMSTMRISLLRIIYKKMLLIHFVDVTCLLYILADKKKKKWREKWAAFRNIKVNGIFQTRLTQGLSSCKSCTH